MKVFQFILFPMLAFILSCSRDKMEQIENKREIIKEFNIHEVKGETVMYGDPELTISNDIVIIDSLFILIDLSQNGKIFRGFSLKEQGKTNFFGERGLGPNDFLYPISFNSINQDKSKFDVFDLNRTRVSEIHVLDDNAVDILSSQTIPPLMASFNINKIGTNTYLGTKYGEESEGLFFMYNHSKDSLSWIEYSSNADKGIDRAYKYNMYYNTLCASEKGIAVGLRYFNRVLFYNLEGELLKEIQLGGDDLYPEWDFSSNDIDYSSRSYLLDMCITDHNIYCLWVDSTSEDTLKPSKIFVFDWSYNYLSTILLDKSIVRITVSNDDAFILGVVDDGTGLTNIIKYDINLYEY